MSRKELINYWIESSDIDFSTMESLYRTKHYSWSLFIGHLVIEKLLKAYYIKVLNENPPLIHNLLRLAAKSKIEMDVEDEEFFSEVTTFNINARYDDYKMEFYKKCTKEYSTFWHRKIKEYTKWIKKELLKL
jgi:HEPN domain-containing protein